MMRLRVFPAQGENFEVVLDEVAGERILGRASDCDVTIPDRYLSRRHAKLFARDGRWWIEDLGSRNGTSRNGRRLTGAEPLEPGDEIVVSGSSLTVGGGSERPTASHAVSRGHTISNDYTVFRDASEVLESHASLPEADLASMPELRTYASRLQILNQVHQLVANADTFEELLTTLLEQAFELLTPEEAVVVLRQADGGYEPAARKTATAGDEEHPVSATLVREVAEKGMSALVLDAAEDERFAEAESIMMTGMRSLIAAPLTDTDGPLGLVALSARLEERQFTEEDMELLTSLAAVAALRMRNLALAAEAEERRRLEREVELARQIQLGLLPTTLPDLGAFEVRGGTVPSQGVSGDFYEVIDHGDGGATLAVVDVSGKGISASLLTASLEALFAGALESERAPARVCAGVSRQLFTRTPPAKYATALLAKLDLASGELRWTNAGHNPGLVVRSDGAVEELGTTGPPLGLLETADFADDAVGLEPGDLAVLYTDGITEAENPDEEEFGLERLRETCREHRTASLEEIARAVDEAVTAFVGDVPFADDRTLVLLRRRAETG